MGGSEPRQISNRRRERGSRGSAVARRKSYCIPSLGLHDGTKKTAELFERDAAERLSWQQELQWLNKTNADF